MRTNRFVLPDHAYAVTAVVLGRQHLLDGKAGELVVSALEWLHRNRRAAIYAFVVMPDHVHAIVGPHGANTLPEVMKSWKGFSAREIQRRRATQGPFWQEGYFDRAIRGPRDAWDMRRYIENNPVRAGLVEKPEHYRLSSGSLEMGTWISPIE